MTRRARKFSPQTAAVLSALASRQAEWRHGYDLSRDTGLASGTLYPLLVRLHDTGLLEAEWRASPKPGRPPRHAYRLTREGLARAREATAAQRSVPASNKLSGALA